MSVFQAMPRLLDATLIDSQYIGTDTRYTLLIAESVELVARVQNIDDLSGDALSIGQPVKLHWLASSTTVLDH